MSAGFVSLSEQPVALSVVKKLVRGCFAEKGLVCLRSPHKIELLPFSALSNAELRCTEGQAFDHQRELRWRKVGDAYDILLLSTVGNEAIAHEIGLKAMQRRDTAETNEPIHWEVRLLNALAYADTETRLPRSAKIPNGLDIQQRYFIDDKTKYVQFVSLVAQHRVPEASNR